MEGPNLQSVINQAALVERMEKDLMRERIRLRRMNYDLKIAEGASTYDGHLVTCGNQFYETCDCGKGESNG